MLNKRYNIGVVIDLEWPLNRHYEVFSGIQTFANEQLNLELIPTPHPQRVLDYNPRAYDALVGRLEGKAIEAGKKYNLPMVNVMTNSSDPTIPSVTVDYKEAGRMCSEHLQSRGIEKIVQIGFENDASANLCEEGILEHQDNHHSKYEKITISRDYAENDHDWQDFYHKIKNLCQNLERKIGLWTINSELSRNIATICNSLNVRIPHDIAMVSLGNDSLICESMHPRLTSIDMGFFRSGYQAMNMLYSILSHQELRNKHELIKPACIISRESTDQFIMQDQHVADAMRFISNNYQNNNIQISDIVATLGISRRSLEKKFKHEIGHTLLDELNRVRLKNFKRLLIETSKSANALSTIAGFSSHANMWYTFKKNVNMTPNEFRKLYKSA